MKIQLTGAIVEKSGDQYQVVYQDRILFRSKLREVCINTALDQRYLDQLISTESVVIKLRAA